VDNYLAVVGSGTLQFLQQVGAVGVFVMNFVSRMFLGRFYFRQFLRQLWQIGYHSLPVVGLTAVFTGAVLALQSYTGFSRFNAESSIASVVVLSITRELGPVLAGLMLAGRIGAAIAAEIGTMKVTEQLDALYTLNTDPYRYLVVPRVLAGIISMPLLVLIADIIGVLGGYVISVYTLDFNPQTYIKKTLEFLEVDDVISGLIKAAFFGFVVSVMGCFHGYSSKGGAQGVGRATTSAVVSASILILLSNYIITGLLFHN
jgi:phospholipid/cholesterol/gamma-HCH transport system permease protein